MVPVVRALRLTLTVGVILLFIAAIGASVVARATTINRLWVDGWVARSVMIGDSRVCLTRFWMPASENGRGGIHAWQFFSQDTRECYLRLFDVNGRWVEGVGIEMLGNPLARRVYTTPDDHISSVQRWDHQFRMAWPYGRIVYETGDAFHDPQPSGVAHFGILQVTFNPLHVAILSVLGFLGLHPALLTKPYRTWRSRRLPPYCRGCGYDLRASVGSGRCPECGQAIGDADRVAIAAFAK